MDDDEIDLTDGDFFGSLLTQTLKEEGESSEEIESEDGPATAGELSEDAPEEQAFDDEVLEQDADEDEEVDETPESEDADEEEPESEEDPQPAKADPIQDQLKQLAQALEQERGHRLQLEGYLKALQQPREQKPARNPESALFEKATRMAMFGGKPEEWERIPPAVREEATEFARLYGDQQTRFALNPELRFQHEILPYVEKLVQERLEPLIQRDRSLTVKEVVEPIASKLKTPEDRKRFGEIFKEVPGADSNELADVQKALTFAQKLFDSEKERATLSVKTQKAEAQQRTQSAIKKARSRGTRGGKRASSGKKALPELKNPASIDSYFRNLLENADQYDLE